MQEALGLARLGWGKTNPNPMVGAVVVNPEGRIIGRGYHVRAGQPHAEVNAIQDALRHYGSCQGCTIYVTLEPCCTTGRTPPCTQAIIDNGFACVVTGALDPNPKHAGRGVKVLQEAGIKCITGVCQDECIELNRPFFKYITAGKPFVILKMAMTLDGKIANPDGISKWITGVEARSRVQQLRRLSDAIMVGGGTLRADKPGLTVREPEEWTPVIISLGHEGDPCLRSLDCIEGFCCARHFWTKICKPVLHQGEVCTKQRKKGSHGLEIFQRCDCAKGLSCKVWKDATYSSKARLHVCQKI